MPGAFTLWTTAEPDHLGRHASDPSDLIAALGETDRGILYTCRAGFVDLSHVRYAADWTRAGQDAVLACLREGGGAVVLHDATGVRYGVTVTVPQAWASLDAAERAARERELARVAGQRIAHVAVTWHEVATWFGSCAIPFIPEDRSAFTYDDMVAHLVGIRLAGEALADVDAGRAPTFDEAMTSRLEGELRRLGACTARETEAAAFAVEGRWWRDGLCIRRQVVSGLDGRPVTPWTVPGFGPCDGIAAEAQAVPWLGSGVPANTPRVLSPVRMHGVASFARSHRGASSRQDDGDRWRPADEVIATWMSEMADEMRRQLGETFDSPQ